MRSGFWLLSLASGPPNLHGSLRRATREEALSNSCGWSRAMEAGCIWLSNLESIHREVQSQGQLPRTQEEQALCLVNVTVQLCQAKASHICLSWHLVRSPFLPLLTIPTLGVQLKYEMWLLVTSHGEQLWLEAGGIHPAIPSEECVPQPRVLSSRRKGILSSLHLRGPALCPSVTVPHFPHAWF